jgi:hypothetical protein
MKDFLKKAFPYLTIAASAVPGGNVATTVLGKILNLKDGATLDDAGVALMNATPEQRKELLAEENRHAEAMQQMGINSAEEFEKISAGDRSDARNMAVKTGDVWTPRILACFIVVAWTFVQWYLLSHVVDPSMRELVARILGTLDAALMAVLYFYFGSSASSRNKDEALAQAVQK